MNGSSVTRPDKNFTSRRGIYRVTHLPSGRTQLGWSAHVQGLLNRIRFQLELRGHTNKARQRDWNDSGPDAFRFEVLDDLTPSAPGEDATDDLKALLELWKAQLAPPPELSY